MSRAETLRELRIALSPSYNFELTKRVVPSAGYTFTTRFRVTVAVRGSETARGTRVMVQDTLPRGARLVSQDSRFARYGNILEAEVEVESRPVELSYEVVFEEPPLPYLPPATLYFGGGSLESERPSVHVAKSILEERARHIWGEEPGIFREAILEESPRFVREEKLEVPREVIQVDEKAEPLDALVLDDEVREQVDEYLKKCISYLRDSSRFDPPNLIVHGPDGAGRESLVRALAHYLKEKAGADFAVFDGMSPLFRSASYYDALRASAATSKVIVILNVDYIEPYSSLASYVNSLRWYKHSPILICTASDLSRLEREEPSLLSAGGFELLKLNRALRNQVEEYVRRKGLEIPGSVLGELEGMAWREIAEFCSKLALRRSIHRDESIESSCSAVLGTLRSRQHTLEALRDTPNYEEIRGFFSEDVVKQLDAVVSARMLDTGKKFIERKIVLTGPNTSGKTLLVTSFAKEIGVKTFQVISPEIFASPYGLLVGQAEHRVLRCFAEAESRAPSVILIEDMDELFSSEARADLYSRLLLILEERMKNIKSEVYVFATCKSLTDNIKRVFGEDFLVLSIDMPDSQRRKLILEYFARKIGVSIQSGDLEKYSGNLTEGWTMKELENLVKFAALNAAKDNRPVSSADLAAAYTLIVQRRLASLVRRG